MEQFFLDKPEYDSLKEQGVALHLKVNSQVGVKVGEKVKFIATHAMRTPPLVATVTELERPHDDNRIVMSVELCEEAGEMPLKPPLGGIKQLHQAHEGTNVCLCCKKPMAEWQPNPENGFVFTNVMPVDL